MSEWQPIETAPLEVDVLLYDPSKMIGVQVGMGYKHPNGLIDWYQTFSYPLEPTHWMPLPEPPTLTTTTGTKQGSD